MQCVLLSTYKEQNCLCITLVSLKCSYPLASSHAPLSLQNELLLHKHKRQFPWVHFVEYLDLGKSEKCTSFNQVIRFTGKNCLHLSAGLHLTALASSQTYRTKGASSATVTELSQLLREQSYCTKSFIFIFVHSTYQSLSFKLKENSINTELKLNKRLRVGSMNRRLELFRLLHLFILHKNLA